MNLNIDCDTQQQQVVKYTIWEQSFSSLMELDEWTKVVEADEKWRRHDKNYTLQWQLHRQWVL